MALPVLALSVWGVLHTPTPLYDDACLTTPAGLVVCAASEMARITRTGNSVLEHSRFDLSGHVERGLSNADKGEGKDKGDQKGDGLKYVNSLPAGSQSLRWQAARNETISFQLIVRRQHRKAPAKVTVELPQGDLQSSLFQAHYVQITDGGYQWGPQTAVLPYPAAYPDALVPQKPSCSTDTTALFDQVSLPRTGRNQSIWVELYVPDDVSVGEHRQRIRLIGDDGNGDDDDDPMISARDQQTIELEVTVDVVDVLLPHKPSIDAVGEIYRAYRLEGAGEDPDQPGWQQMSHCYQTLAHQHRMVFIERTPDAPATKQQWNDYVNTFGPALTGTLFSVDNGYRGTGLNTPVSVWRTPWPQELDMIVDAPLSIDQLDAYTRMAASWAEKVNANHWQNTRYFAYVFDEVDGPDTLPESDLRRQAYVARVHADIQAVQQAIDDGVRQHGVGLPAVDLLWTSHSDPAIWLDDPDTTLVDRVRLWAPNAHAANTEFLAQRMALGERAWFYHSGHPAVGGHSINLPGTDMRSWGVIGARYGFQGQLMWSVNLGSDELPFAQPSYKLDDDRVGNGVMVYPGNQLPRIGYRAAAGPIPSMRLKAWRRGLQDAELYYLARQRFPAEADASISALIPRALGEAVAAGDSAVSWPRDAASWIQWRDDLLLLLSRD